ncbi:flagellar basal body P-ring protein FlgI [Natronospora cellulosivora (SeqCode)]
MNDKLKFIKILLVLFVLMVSLGIQAEESHDPLVSIGNITRIRGVRTNQLHGFGLIIGLAGTGDSNRYGATVTSHANMLNNMGIEVTADQINSRNVAAVMVTAVLPAFAHEGDTIDVTVSSLGDARSLQGGTLFMTPLRAANGEIYAVAQGPSSIGGFNVQGAGGQEQRQNHPTVATIPNGAMVEREVEFSLSNEEIVFLLDNENSETARNITNAINQEFEEFGQRYANARTSREVVVEVPESYRNDLVAFIAEVEKLEVRPAIEARVIINERTGTISMGHNVRISTVTVAHGNLTVSIDSSQQVSQPPAFTDGETVITEETDITIEEDEAYFMLLPSTSSVQDLVAVLNTIGATPRDIIAILQNIKAQGALHAKLELR